MSLTTFHYLSVTQSISDLMYFPKSFAVNNEGFFQSLKEL